jgi:hypothetical protein
MSIEMLAEVLEQSKAKGSARLLLITLAWRSINGSREVERSIEYMTKDTGLSRRQVFDNLTKLYNIGELEKSNKKGTHGGIIYRFPEVRKISQAVRKSAQIVRETAQSGGFEECGKPHTIVRKTALISEENRTTPIKQLETLKDLSPISPQIENPELPRASPNGLTNEIKTNQPDMINNKLADDFSEWFEIFWKLYPKGRGNVKQTCKEKLSNITEQKPEIMESVLDGLKCWVNSHEWKTAEAQKYIPLATTWINGRRWELEAEAYDPKKDKSKKCKVYTNAAAGWEKPANETEKDDWW